MKSAKTWCLAGLVLVGGLSSASCGKDEGTSGGGGKGTIVGGSAGTSSGGMVGRSGSGGSSQGGNTTVSGSKLGRACVSDKDCTDAAAPDLTCVTSKDTVLGNGAPPKGLCTMPCTLQRSEEDEDTCGPLGFGALCVPFEAGSDDGYCMEGCSFGPAEIGETKCHNRPEFACDPALYTPTGVQCDTTDDCPSGDLCFDGECDAVAAACLPSCRGDLDCDAGMFCDIGFLNGTCVAEKVPGKQLGEPCTLPAAGEPSEPDECLGFCQADAATGNAGHCAATCGLGRQCSWNAATEKFDGICFYPTILTNSAATAAVGDFGFCTPSCNCSSDCNDPALGCELLDEGPLSPDFLGAGLCFSPGAMTVEYDQCSGAGGAGGAGGAASSAGGAGNAGESAGGAGGAN